MNRRIRPIPSSLTSVAEIPGYPTKYALFGGPQTRTKAVIAAQMLPQPAHSMLRGLSTTGSSIIPVLDPGWISCPTVSLATTCDSS